MEEYNADGFLPIHEAAFRGYVTAVERFIVQQVDNEDDEDEENGAKREIILYDQLESRSIDDLRLTPLMAATVGGSRDVVQSLIKLGAKVTATDSQNRTIVGIAIMKQNVDLILYFNEQTYAPSLDIWNTIVKLFSSQTNDNECIAAARIIELLTREKYLNDYWPLLVNCGVMKHLIDMLNTCTIDDVLISCLLILLNVINIYPDVKHRFIQNDCAKAFVQVKKLSKQIVTLYGHVLSRLCDQSECIHALVHNEIIKEIHNILHMDNSFVSPILIYPYFDSLSKIALAKREYQLLIQYQTQIVQRTIYYLEMFDRQLTISIYHFIRELVMKNEEQQIIIAKNLNLTAFLFSSLHSTQHDVQRSAVECIQAIVEQNHETQMMIMDQGGVEQLMNLLRKSNIQMLRIAIICTLWSLTGNSHARRRKMAITIGVKTLVEFFSLRSTDYLLTIVEAIGELARLVRTKYMHYQLEIGRKHCISPFVRMLKFDNDLLVLSCLRTLQNLCLTPTYIPCRQNQTILRKADGISQLVNLIKMSKNEVIQAEATLGLTCALFDNKENKEILANSNITLIMNILHLMSSKNELAQVTAGMALVTFVYHDIGVYEEVADISQLNHEHFLKLYSSKTIETRLKAAFQEIILIRLISNVVHSDCMANALIILINHIVDPTKNHEEKILSTELLARIARYRPGLCQAIIAINGIEILCTLLHSENEILQANAALCLGCLAKLPEGQRKILQQCRYKPQRMDIIKLYNCLPDRPWPIAQTFLQQWERYEHLILPMIKVNKH